MKNFVSILVCVGLLFNYSYAELDDIDTNETVLEEIVTTEEIPIEEPVEEIIVVEDIIEEIIEEEQQIIEEEENIVEELPQEVVEENEPEEPVNEEKQEVEPINEEKPEVEEPILEEQEPIPEETIIEEPEPIEEIVVEEPIPEEVTIEEEEEEPFVVEIPEPYCYITSSIGEDEIVYSGQEITFTLHLVNFTGNYTITWQYSEDGMNFNDIENEHGETYSFIITRANAHYAYRAIVEVEE